MKTDKKKLLSIAKKIKAVAMDVDGCLLPDVECLLPEGKVAKFRSRVDGQGVSLMRAIGLKIVFITAENRNSVGYQPIKRLVDNWNHLPSSQKNSKSSGWPLVEVFGDTGERGWSKNEILSGWLSKEGILPQDCAVMGDDLVDIPMLKIGGLRVAPATAEKIAKDLSHWVTPRGGGAGAVRDLANLLLEAKRIDVSKLPVK